MLHLNLISQQLKIEIKLRHIYEMSKKIFFIVAIILISVSIIILFAKLIIQNSFNQIVEQTTLITQNFKSSDIKFKQINAQLDYIDQMQNNFTTWSFLFDGLFNNIDQNNINFTSIKINQDQKTIILSGFAKSREALLELKKQLENSAMFFNINLPIQNLLKQTDINFKITASLNLEKINSSL